MQNGHYYISYPFSCVVSSHLADPKSVQLTAGVVFLGPPWLPCPRLQTNTKLFITLLENQDCEFQTFASEH